MQVTAPEAGTGPAHGPAASCPFPGNERTRLCYRKVVTMQPSPSWAGRGKVSGRRVGAGRDEQQSSGRGLGK